MFEHPGDDSRSSETCAARCSRLTHLGHVTRRRSTQQAHNFVQPVLNLSSFFRGRGWLWWCWCMCLESKYLIGFKILSRVLVCVCACVWDERRRGDGSPCSCREEEHRDQSANWEISTFTIYTYLQFTLFTIFPLPAQPSDAQSVRRAGRGCTVGSCSLHGDIVTSIEHPEIFVLHIFHT